MPDFAYEALDRAGNATTGTITASDTQDAAVKVRALGVYPTQLTTAAGKTAPKATKSETGEPARRSGRLNRMHLLLFTREMSDLLDAGLPMDRAFSVLIEQSENQNFHDLLSAMQGDIRAGQPLSEALAKFPKEFPPLYYNMVRAGEVSGKLPEVMMRLADFMEKEQTRRSQIISALTYPAILVAVAIFSLIFLLTFAIPRLAGVFKGMKADLPAPTQMLLGLSGFIGKFWWLILLVLVGGWYAFRLWTQTTQGRQTYDGFRLRVPILGKLHQKLISARLVRTLGTLLGGGVPILEAMDISASALGNVIASEALLMVRGGVRQGETLNHAMERSPVFLPVVRHMTAVGEETGRLPSLLLRTADTLDFEVDSTMRRLTSLVEPMVVLFMGAFVGFVVLSILLPIFQINTLVK
jgi:type II secretion system protein F